MTRLYLVAGESSGDLHGANLIRALRQHDPDLECEGLGGRRMAAEGMTLHYDLAAHAIMGFSEVVKSLGLIRRLFNQSAARLREGRPDALVLIDYPGFNMRLARFAHALGIKVIFYISPQVWAWRRGRVKTLARILDKMLVILPFEKEIYDAAGLDCAYVGHPLLDHVAAFEPKGTFVSEMTIGLMPGSRQQEIQRIFPIMLEVAHGLRFRYPGARFVTPCVDDDRRGQIDELAGDFPLETVVGGTYELLSAARFCLVASGTATVETLLFNVPMIVLYRTSGITYRLARRLAQVDTIAMVNILAGRKFVPEFVQQDAVPETILVEAAKLIEDGPERAAMTDEFERVRDMLGQGGASENAAREIFATLGETHGG